MMTTASTTTSPQATTISEKKKEKHSLNERQMRLRGSESGNEIETERQIGRER